LTTFDVVSVGDGTSIGMDTSLDGSWVEGGSLHIAPIKIGRDCFVGNRCAIGANTVMEDGTGLGDLSMLPDGSRVPAGELWTGSPAGPAGRLEPEPDARHPGEACLGTISYPLLCSQNSQQLIEEKLPKQLLQFIQLFHVNRRLKFCLFWEHYISCRYWHPKPGCRSHLFDEPSISGFFDALLYNISRYGGFTCHKSQKANQTQTASFRTDLEDPRHRMRSACYTK
jgi:hypothetical protein